MIKLYTVGKEKHLRESLPIELITDENVNPWDSDQVERCVADGSWIWEPAAIEYTASRWGSRASSAFSAPFYATQLSESDVLTIANNILQQHEVGLILFDIAFYEESAYECYFWKMRKIE